MYATAEERQCCEERGERLANDGNSQQDDFQAGVAGERGVVAAIGVHLPV